VVAAVLQTTLPQQLRAAQADNLLAEVEAVERLQTGTTLVPAVLAARA
jgi:hypothetical protein